jgi:plastocyanin
MKTDSVLLVLPLLCFLLACAGDDSRESTIPLEDAADDATAPLEGSSFEPRPYPYETIAVKEGGAVKGAVRLSASLPPLAGTSVLKDQATCGEHTPDSSLELGEDDTIANVVVSLVGVTKGKAMKELAEPAKLDQRRCVYIPHVQIVPPGTTLDIYNSDPILHNVHGYLNDGETIFNLAMPIQGFRIQRRLDDPGLVSLKCDAGHTWMRGYIVVKEHPYYALTGADGSYLIDDVPALELTAPASEQ